jgi:hypothetical protein
MVYGLESLPHGAAGGHSHRSLHKVGSHRVRGIAALLVAGTLFLTGAAPAGDAASGAWQDDFTSRVEVLALLQTLNSQLLGHDSATLTLDAWCAAHRMAAPARIVAEQVRGAQKAPEPEVLQLLGVGADAVKYRHVRLHCGGHVLSEADNWYVPARLTPQMNHVLETTDTAFGRAVQDLHFQRHTLAVKLLWSPLPEGWETGAALPPGSAAALEIPAHVIEHRAVLSLPDGRPFSLVVETYTAEVLSFPPPPVPVGRAH